MMSNDRLQPKPGVLPFAVAITVLNLLGHLWLGFEQAWLTPLVALTAAYSTELVFEMAIRGWSRARFRGGQWNLAVFLLPAHISGLAIGMLLYTNERFTVVAFAAAVAITSKLLLRVPNPQAGQGASIHFMNPSNFGIAVSLLLFNDWVGVAQPYQFTESINGVSDALLPLVIVCSGSFLNWRATKRLTLVLAWVGCFAAQALVRAWIDGESPLPALIPMTGLAFVLFSFYMISDPMTTPRALRGQVAFGAGTATLYGVLTYLGIVFGLFFALSAMCLLRGLLLWLRAKYPAAGGVVGDVAPRSPANPQKI
jgi:hypothetical protein